MVLSFRMERINQPKPDEMLSLPRVHWAARHSVEEPTVQAGLVGRESMLFHAERGRMQVDMSDQTFEVEAGTLLILPMGVS